jgi:hypothetical protein
MNAGFFSVGDFTLLEVWQEFTNCEPLYLAVGRHRRDAEAAAVIAGGETGNHGEGSVLGCRASWLAMTGSRAEWRILALAAHFAIFVTVSII